MSSAEISILTWKKLSTPMQRAWPIFFEMFGLTQRVQGITQYRGGMLDLEVTSEDISDISVTVDPPRVISCDLVVADFPMQAVRVSLTPRTVRGWRSVDRTAFAETIACSPLGRAPSANTAAADELFADYDRVLGAPAPVVMIRVRSLSPWFDSECRAT